MTKFSIITPCFNAEKYIKETLDSVLNQHAVQSQRIELEYIICDGQSSDRTVEVIQSTIQQLSPTLKPSVSVRLISEPDGGMYDALAKGLQQASGDIVAYINAGDVYHLHAFDVVMDVFQTQQAQWITGYAVCYNEQSQVIEVNLPFRYHRALLACGYYGNGLPHVQQESTFWNATLNRVIDFAYLAKLKYAGDAYLWSKFAEVADLKVVRSHLGGFRFHAGQLSGQMVNRVNAYQVELTNILKKPGLQERAIATLDRLLWSAPYKVKKWFCKQGFFSYDKKQQTWLLE